MRGVGKHLRNALSSIDLYGEKYNFLFKRDETYSHPLGQLLSLGIMALTFFSFISLSIEMFSLSDPNLVSNIQANLNPEVNIYAESKLYFLTPDNFFLAVGVADYRGYPIVNTPNETWYESKLWFCRQITTSVNISQNCQYVDLISCPYANISEQFIQGIEHERLALASCVNNTQWDELRNISILKGIGSSNDFAYMYLTVGSCNQTVVPNSCVSLETVQARLGYGGFIESIFTDRLLDQSKAGNPYNLVAKTMTTPFTMQSTTFVRNTLRHSHLISTENFYYYFPQSENYHSLTLQNQVETQLSNNFYFMQMNFFLDDREEFFTRTYSTFFDVFGNIGGLQQFLCLVLGFVISPMTKRNQKLALINQVFTFEDDDLNKQSTQKSYKVYFSTQFKRKSQIISFDMRDQVDVKKLLNQKNRKLQFKWYESLIATFGRKKSMFDVSVRMLEQQIDVSHLINKVFELEKLKRFLLDDDQLKLFEYIPKPIINHKNIVNGTLKHSDTSLKQSWLLESEDTDVKLQHALDSFRILKQSLDPLNIKLIQMMDPSLRDYLDNHTGDLNHTKSGLGGIKKMLWDDLDSNKSPL